MRRLEGTLLEERAPPPHAALTSASLAGGGNWPLGVLEHRLRVDLSNLGQNGHILAILGKFAKFGGLNT